MSPTSIPALPDFLGRTTPKLAELTQQVLFGDIWERAGLSKRDRSLVTCAVLTALYRSDQLRFHLKLALTNGLTPEEISEMVTHAAFYAGWPAAVQAAQLADEVFHAAS